MSLAMARTLQFIASSEDSVTPSELSEGLGRSPAATSSLIKRLISDESVEVLVDPDDRRSFRISLTKVGMKKWRNIEPVLIDVESKISGGYGVNRLKSLAADLGDLKATVEASVG
jgi:DNA-binding MarR family transcriptional regulator